MKYSTDLTDSQWQQIESIFQTSRGKNFVKHSKRELVNAVLYLIKTGCQWRLLPNDFPPYPTVWSFYRRAVISGKWEKAMDMLVEKTRQKAKRLSTPTYGIIDSQSVKTTFASQERGFDGSTQWGIYLRSLFTPQTFTIQSQGLNQRKRRRKSIRRLNASVETPGTVKPSKTMF